MSHGGGGSERWLVSYADFITLLMVLFVVLYSMGQTDIERYKKLADSLRAAFSGGPAQVVDPLINQGGAAEKEEPAPIMVPGIPQSPINSVEVAGRLTDMLAASNLGGSVSVQNNVEGVLISLSEKLLFEPGKAVLQEQAYPVLDAVIEMVQHLDHQLRVVGHTDDTRPDDSRYDTNWELSVARALTIVQYMVDQGIDPRRITASGQGEYHPVFPNDSAEHRRLNGRADIVIIYPVDTEVIDLDWSTESAPQSPDPAPGSPGE
jgi:chemotaxis protein MotB